MYKTVYIHIRNIKFSTLKIQWCIMRFWCDWLIMSWSPLSLYSMPLNWCWSCPFISPSRILIMHTHPATHTHLILILNTNVTVSGYPSETHASSSSRSKALDVMVRAGINLLTSVASNSLISPLKYNYFVLHRWDNELLGDQSTTGLCFNSGGSFQSGNWVPAACVFNIHHK